MHFLLLSKRQFIHAFRSDKLSYLAVKVIDETLRVVNVSLFTYREAKTDVNICGKLFFWFLSSLSFFLFFLFFWGLIFNQ